MSYIIKCWIPIEPEHPKVYETCEEAHLDLEQLELMQPENIYEIEKVQNFRSGKTWETLQEFNLGKESGEGEAYRNQGTE